MIKIATNVESIFHGKSSGVDIQTVVKGGVVYANNGKVVKIPHQLDEIWIIDTGRPSFSTKNVVTDVYDNFASSKAIWNEMGDVTSDVADIMKSREKLWQKIAHNEMLLEKISIVIPKVKTFLQEIKKQGIYGKICGAGTIASREKDGGNGVIGIFQILTKEQRRYLLQMCKKNHFKLKKVFISNAGLTINSKSGLFGIL